MPLTPSTVRLDLKCGRGAISEGEKCTKGPAKKASLAEKALKKGGAAVALGGLGYSVANAFTGNINQATAGLAAFQAGSAAWNAGRAKEYTRKGQKQKALASKFAAAYNVGGAALLGAQAGFGMYEARRRTTRGTDQRTGYNNQRTSPNKAVRDPFKDLGVSSRSSNADIKAAWKKAMRENHPDVGGDPEKAKSINAAYQEILRRRGVRDSIYADGFEIDWELVAL